MRPAGDLSKNHTDMINKVILIGNVGADPEIRTLESGVKMARLRIATTERIYNRESQEARDHTEWHSVVLWRNLADVADRFVRKGSQVYIEGRLRSREWTDQQGVKRYSIEIVADDMKMLGRKPESSAGAQPLSSQSVQQSSGQSHSGAYQSGGNASHPASDYRQSPPSAPQVNLDDDPDDLPF